MCLSVELQTDRCLKGISDGWARPLATIGTSLNGSWTMAMLVRRPSVIVESVTCAAWGLNRSTEMPAHFLY